MKKTLVIFAHPYLEYLNYNIELINYYIQHPDYTLKDLYEEYPDFHIFALKERKKLKDYDRFIFHFPLIWFGMPPLLKLWIDEVFDRNWLTENIDNPLEKKEVYIIVSTGGRARSFSENGTYKYSIEELLSGLTVSLNVFKANIKEFLTIYETNKLTQEQISLQKQKIIELLNQ